MTRRSGGWRCSGSRSVRLTRIALAVAAAALGCSPAHEPPSDDATNAAAVERGSALVNDPTLSTLSTNPFACTTCHALTPGEDDLVKPGAPLAGATLRPTYWAGEEDDLLAALDVCLTRFMQSSSPLARDDGRAADLYAFLVSLEPGDALAQPFTIVDKIADVPHGNAAAGKDTYRRACIGCHGGIHAGSGRASPVIPTLPEDVLRSHSTYDAQSQRLIFVEKVRHGGFLGYGGTMAPFSKESLSDEELGNVLEALGVLGGSG